MESGNTEKNLRTESINIGVTVYFIPRIFYPGDSIYYPADSIPLVYFIPRQDILSLHGDQGMSQYVIVAVLFITFKSVIVSRNTLRPCYVSKRAYSCRVREF